MTANRALLCAHKIRNTKSLITSMIMGFYEYFMHIRCRTLLINNVLSGRLFSLLFFFSFIFFLHFWELTFEGLKKVYPTLKPLSSMVFSIRKFHYPSIIGKSFFHNFSTAQNWLISHSLTISNLKHSRLLRDGIRWFWLCNYFNLLLAHCTMNKLSTISTTAFISVHRSRRLMKSSRGAYPLMPSR